MSKFNYLNLYENDPILREAYKRIEELARNHSSIDLANRAVRLAHNPAYDPVYNHGLYLVNRGLNYRLFSAEPHIRSDGHADWHLNRDIALMEGFARNLDELRKTDTIFMENFPDAFGKMGRFFKLK